MSVTGNDIVVNLATDATGALTSTAAQVVDGDQRQRRPRARCVNAYTLPRQRGRGHRRPARAAVQLSDFLNAPARRPARRRSRQRCCGSASSATAPRSASSSTASSTRASGSTPITCLRRPSGCCATTRSTRRPRSYSTTSTSSSSRRSNPDGAHYSFYDNNVQRRNLVNHCPLTGDDRRPARRATPWASTSTATTRRLALRRLRRARSDATCTQRARYVRARARPPSRRSRTSSGSWTRSRTSSSRSTSTPTAATSCGRRAPTSRGAA